MISIQHKFAVTDSYGNEHTENIIKTEYEKEFQQRPESRQTEIYKISQTKYLIFVAVCQKYKITNQILLKMKFSGQ